MRSYKFDKYKTTKIKNSNHLILNLINLNNFKKLNHKFNLVSSINFAKDLVSEPANILNPIFYSNKCLELKKIGLKVKVLNVDQLEKIGIPMVNSRICLERAADKYRTYLRIKDFGLEQPKTVLCPSPDLLEKSFENLDTKFPIILKTLRGSKGVGVLFVETERSLNSLVQTLYKMDSQTDLLMQEYIKTDFDVRAIVLDGKVIAAMRRNVVEGDFRSNASQGAEVETIKLTKLEEDQCIHAAKSIGGIFTGVDFIPSKNIKYTSFFRVRRKKEKLSFANKIYKIHISHAI